VGWYIVIKTIKGRKYRYRQRTWREGGRVRTQSFSLGPIGGDEAPARAEARAKITIDPRAKALVKEHLMPVFTALCDQRNVIPQKEAPWDETGPSPGTFRNIPELDALIQASGARIGLDHYEAKYSIDHDFIVLPEARTFRERPFLSATEGYYVTLLHEMAHWTGSAKRLDRFKRSVIGPH
jgi:antirestriction protein ArdC